VKVLSPLSNPLSTALNQTQRAVTTAKNTVSGATRAVATRTAALDQFSPASLLSAPRTAFGDVENLVAQGLKLASSAGNVPLGFFRSALESVLGKSSKDEIGWIQDELPQTIDRTASFKSLYSAAKSGESILPPDANQYVYLTLRGYTGDNFPTYMKQNREALERRGLDVREVKTDTEQTVENNAKVVRDAILQAASEGKQVVLIGHSKGGMDMTAAVAMYPELKPHVRAAVAMQSPYGGVPVASDIQDEKIVANLAGKAIEWVLRGDEASLPDFSYEKRRAFIEQYPWPSDIPTVSLSTSSGSQLNGLTPVINWYKLRYGEKTDGIVAQRDTEIPGSRVVRLDNLDHLNSVMPEFPGRANYDPGLLTEALVALALRK